MRPTTGTMLQQNNNNNYPCMSMSDCPKEMLQKCSRASLPFPSRVELVLGDLPLIRGLRAWALCSKNRRKADTLLGGGKAPTAPPLGRGTSTSCPRPADVYLSGYGLPLGLDARQAGIGALVTVATLKTSKGSGKTQTQCFFLRTEKGSCLYSTAKPGSGASPSMVGEWLRGKRGGGTDPLTAETGANRVRVRSGRRWRKSGITAGRERKAVSRERQQRSCKNNEPSVEVKQEERDKEGLDRNPFPSLQLDNSKTDTRMNDHEEHEEGESPAREAASRLNREEKGAGLEKQRDEEEGKVSKDVPDATDPYLGSNSNGSSDVGGEQEMKKTERLEWLQTSRRPGDITRREEDPKTDLSKERKPEKECNHDPEPESEMELASVDSSFPLEGTVCTDRATCWLYSQQDGHQTQHKVELEAETERRVVIEEEPDVSGLHSQELNFAVDESDTVKEETREPHVFLEHEEDNSLQEEKGVVCSPVKQRDLSVSEKPEGRIGKLEDECTCIKQDCGGSDEEEQRSRASADDCSSQSHEPCLEKEGDASTRVEKNGQKSLLVFNGAEPSTSNPAPSLPPRASIATGLPCREVEEKKGEAVGATPGHEGGRHKQERSPRGELEEKAEEASDSTVATEDGSKEEEEDEFGGFMQAEGEPAWSEGVNMCSSVPCGNRASIAHGNDMWTAFPQDASNEHRDAAEEQWWPPSALEARRERSPTNRSLAAVFAEAFPPMPSFSTGDPCDLEAIPTLMQLLHRKAGQEDGILDSFHDLNKMICQSHKRSNGASQNLLLKTLLLQQPLPESRPTSWMTNRRLFPGLPSANQHAVAKRRLSYDYNRNILE